MAEKIRWEAIDGRRTWRPEAAQSISRTSFYPGVEHVQLLDGRGSLRLGTRFETNLIGQDVSASVPELEPSSPFPN